MGLFVCWNQWVLLVFIFQSSFSSDFSGSYISEIGLGETRVAMDGDDRARLESFCTGNQRFSVKASDKKHKVRLEAVVAAGVHGLVCTARSTKNMLPKGSLYAVKLSFEEMYTEALFLSRMQHLSFVIHCLWDCVQVKVTTITKTKVRGVTVPTTRVYNVLPMEYFPSPSIREWLRSMSIQLDPIPLSYRLDLFRNTLVREAYIAAKKAALQFWTEGWIHRDMHAGNFLWNVDTKDIRIIDVAMSTRFGYHMISQLDWMHNIGRDFRFFAYTFGLSIMCPEEWLTPPPGLPRDPSSPNPRTSNCINFNEILPIMRQFDPEFNMVLTYMITGHKHLELLPPRFKTLAQRFAPNRYERPTVTSEQVMQSSSGELQDPVTRSPETPQRTSVGVAHIQFSTIHLSYDSFILLTMSATLVMYCVHSHIRSRTVSLKTQLLNYEEI